jgi:hypothetical protein
MSASNGHSLDPIETGALAADDPRRESLAKALSEAERAGWQREWAEADRLRTLLQQVDMPQALLSRLKQIPGNVPALQPEPAKSLAKKPADWRHVAAVLLVGGLIAACYAWYTAKPPLMDPAVSTSIATWAIQSSDKPLDITSSDMEAVKKKLESYGFNFPVIMLAPNEASKVTLQGGGMAELGPAKAAYTKWAGDGYHLTLYEFNGKDVNAPRSFQTTAEVPTELWRDDKKYRVLIFPGAGGKCCWALVMDSDTAENAFGQYMYGNY